MDTVILSGPKGTAVLSHCEQYRYYLTRFVSLNPKKLGFVLLNPSTADAFQNDSTVTRCVGFARRHGFGELHIANAYAYRAKRPRDLWATDYPVGPENNYWLTELVLRCDLVICGWGIHCQPLREIQVVEQLSAWAPLKLHHLGRNKNGTPKHPLYLPTETEITPWQL